MGGISCLRATQVGALATAVTLFLLWRRWSDAWGFRLFGLPVLAQELNLFSENAFYYSFYRQVVDAPTFVEALDALRRDSRTEHPEVIDAFARFNLLPEVLLGAAFRLLPQAWRGGVNPFAFFAGAMLTLNALGSAVLCTLSWACGGGELACAAAQLGFSVALLLVPSSRAIGVHVAALRENFALPMLHAQTALLAWMLRRRGEDGSAFHLAGFTLLTALFLLFWQFSGFILCGQVAAVFATSLVCRPVRPLLLRVIGTYGVALSLQAAVMPGGAAAVLSPLPEVLAGVALVACLQPSLCLRWGPGRPQRSDLRGSGRRPLSTVCDGLLDSACAISAFLFLRRIDLRRFVGSGGAALTDHVDVMLEEKLHTARLLLVAAVRAALDAVAPGASESIGTLIGNPSAPNATFDSVVYFEQDEFKALWDSGVWQRNVVASGWRVGLPLSLLAACAASASLLIAASALGASCRTLPLCGGAGGLTAVPSAATCSEGHIGLPATAKSKAREGRIPPKGELSATRLVHLSGASPDLVFLVGLVAFYSALTVLVWRLRVLALPLAAVLAAQVLSPRLWGSACPKASGFVRRYAACSVLAWVLRCALGLGGLALSACYLGKLPEFYNKGLDPDTEREDRWAQYKMFRWIDEHTAGQNVVLAGDAATLASARLALPRAAVTAHPHYEHPRARSRFRAAKERLLACGPASDAHAFATKLRATHLLLDLARLAPSQALLLSPFYKRRRRCREDMGPGLLGMRRTAFQVILGDSGLFEPLHVVGPYVFVRVVAAAAGGSVAREPHGGPAEGPGSPKSWARLLDRCPGSDSAESCAENLGLLARVLADPMRQHGWVRALIADGLARYPKAAKLHALAGRTLDYDLSDFEQAAERYRAAARLQPDRVEHWSALGSLLAQVRGRRSREELREIMEHLAPHLLGSTPGPGPRDLGAQRLCQAAVWSRSLALESRWEAAFWRSAVSRSRMGCIHESWAAMEGSPRQWPASTWDYLRFAD